MSLLHEIQTSVIQNGADLGPILLKLRLLAARLGSQPLADWIKHESEGYPKNAELPGYRTIQVSYTATFHGPFGSGIQNAPIANYLVEKFAGKQWVRYSLRESIAAVDDMLSSSNKGGELGIDASNLILLLQGKVYPDYVCNSVTGRISRSAIASMRYAVQSRVLELTIELEKSVPDASLVTLEAPSAVTNKHAAATTQIAQQIIYGNFTAISATGDSARIEVNVVARDQESLVQYLARSGLIEGDARELAALAASETPDSKSEPMGPKVRGWLVENFKKAASGTSKMGLSVATDIIKEALLKFYDLK